MVRALAVLDRQRGTQALIALHTYVALLYSIILGPTRRLVMADLRDIAIEAGFENPRTLVATGNLVFNTAEALAVHEIESRLEQGLERRFGKHIDVIARSSEAFKALASANPFPRESKADASRVCVRVQRAPLPQDCAADLEPWLGKDDRIRIERGDLWMSFGGAPSASRLLSRLTPKHLGIGTSRNWNTIRGLAEIVEG